MSTAPRRPTSAGLWLLPTGLAIVGAGCCVLHLVSRRSGGRVDARLNVYGEPLDP